jgi:hypothetical protein
MWSSRWSRAIKLGRALHPTVMPSDRVRLTGVGVGFSSQLFGNPEGIPCKLLRCEIEDVVRIQIEHQSYKYHDSKRDKPGFVVD